MTENNNNTLTVGTRHAANFRNLEGQRLNRLTVLQYVGQDKSNAMWLCVCNCKNLVITEGTKLISGRKKSCGCLAKEVTSKRVKTHGRTHTPEYRAWRAMRNRCLRPSVPSFKDYGGRGITVCDRWLESFENFFADMGERPSPDHSLERRENNGNYCPENCYWATWEEQSNNRRTTPKVTFGGKSQTLAQWARDLNVNRHLLYERINRRHWSLEKALTSKIYSRYDNSLK